MKIRNVKNYEYGKLQTWKIRNMETNTTHGK